MPVDYDALAKQHGAVVDYDALAQQHGATSSQPEQKSVGGFLSNVLSSGGKLIGDAASAVAHPLNTLDAIGAIPVGLYEKAGGPLPAAKPGEADAAQQLDAMINHFKSRYGSLDSVKEALYKDPVGVAADVSTLFGGAGGVIKGAGMAADLAGASRVASAATKVAKVASAAGNATSPLGLAARGATAAAKAGANAADASGIASKLYQSALKPGPGSYSLPEVADMVKTGLDNKLPVSAGGVEKLNGLVDDLNNKIKATIQTQGQNVKIDPAAVAQRVDQIRPKFANQVNPVRDLKMLDASQQEFLDMQGVPGSPAVAPQPTGVLNAQGNPVMSAGSPAIPPRPPQPIPAADAQAMKQNTYGQLRNSYGEMKNAQIEAQKALARGIKEELASAIPELGTLNAQESKLLGLQDALERAVRRVDNHDIIGIGAPIVAGAAGTMASHPGLGVAAGVLKSVLDNPMMKSKLAIALNHASAKAGTAAVPGAVPRMATSIARVNDYLRSLDMAPSTALPQSAQAQDQTQPSGPLASLAVQQ